MMLQGGNGLQGRGSNHGLGEENVSCQKGNLVSIPFRTSLFSKYSSFTYNLGGEGFSNSVQVGMDPRKSTETRQGSKYAGRLPCYRKMVEKKEKKTILHLLHIQQV